MATLQIDTDQLIGTVGFCSSALYLLDFGVVARFGWWVRMAHRIHVQKRPVWRPMKGKHGGLRRMR
jgi:hypothetical protein